MKFLLIKDLVIDGDVVASVGMHELDFDLGRGLFAAHYGRGANDDEVDTEIPTKKKKVKKDED